MKSNHPYPSWVVVFLIRKYASSDSRIIDFGCHDGSIGKIIKHTVDCQFWGLDIDNKALKKAGKVLDKVILADIEKPIPDVPKNFFDIIVLSNILEHLRDPVGALKNCQKHLKKDGLMVVAVPNIAYWNIRLELLMGRFTYQKWGILDPDHLRFFTRQTFLKTLNKAGCCPISLSTNYLGWRQKIANFWPTLLASQFIAVVKSKYVKTKIK